MNKPILLATLLSASMLSSVAVAQSNYDDNATGIYVGASYGYLRVDGDDDFDDDKDAYQIFLGYDINKYLAIEGSFIDFGEYGSDAAKADTDGYTLGLKAAYPVSDNLKIYVRGGQLWYETDYSVLSISDKYEDEGLFAGIGIGYQINNDITVKFDYTLYDNDLDVGEAVDDIDDSNFSTDLKHAAVGFEYRF